MYGKLCNLVWRKTWTTGIRPVWPVIENNRYKMTLKVCKEQGPIKTEHDTLGFHSCKEYISKTLANSITFEEQLMVWKGLDWHKNSLQIQSKHWKKFKSWHEEIIYISAQKMNFSIKSFFNKCDRIQRIWSHLLKKRLMESFIFLHFIRNKIKLRDKRPYSNFSLLFFSSKCTLVNKYNITAILLIWPRNIFLDHR